MNIGILTHWWSNQNYGQQLQAYALQSVLRSRGHSPFLIRYCPISAKPNIFFLFGLRVRRLFQNPALFLDYIERKKIQSKTAIKCMHEKRQFERFRQDYLRLSPQIYNSYQQLADAKLEADAYIVGSDQVWNAEFLTQDNNGKPWFLAFGDQTVKRISYAASFGMASISKQYAGFIRPLINNLSSVSVREDVGVDICKSIGRCDVSVVADPTLLLTRKDYLNTFNQQDVSLDEPFAFCYLLKSELNSIPNQNISDFCSDRSLQIKITTVHDYKSKTLQNNYNPTVPEWVNTINHAHYIFTNSFHGVVFSILMNKPFITFLRKGRDSGMNSRIESLLSKLGLNSRVYNNANGSIESQMCAPIDWESVNQNLDKLRQKALMFLENSGL